MKKTCPIGKSIVLKIAKTINTIVSNHKPLTGKPFTGDKCPWTNPVICFYEVEYGDKTDSGDDAVIHVKLIEPLLILIKTPII